MRIAYVIPAWPPQPSQPFVVNEMIEVQRAGHELVVVPLYPLAEAAVRHGTYDALRPVAVLPTRLIDGGTVLSALATVLRHPVRTLRTLGGLHATAGRHLWQHVRLAAITPKALAAARRLRALGVGHVHAHFANQTADCAAIAGSVAGIPFSFTAHAYDIYSTDPKLVNATLPWKLRHARRAFTVSRYAAGLLRALLPASEHERVQVAYVGIPTSLFRFEALPAGDRPLRLLCVARFQEKKGLDTLVDACARLRDRGLLFQLRMFGDGPLRPALAAQIAALGLGELVHLGQPIPQEAVAAEMRACHAFVMPCRRDRTGDMDGIPTVFMEAMASGRPVVSCAVSGVPELVRDGETGLIVPPDDPDALADAVVRLAADGALRERLARAGRALVERQHDQAQNARRVVALLAAGGDRTDPALAARAAGA